ncbi:uncharacterized protein LOC127737028 [Mytilus californianus]|uniref:uncharacterized protein LOC127737028 n=1 Tax=Mytilus californianus TaxID=6549 RepID=UPI002248052B|nr:uncharacterized protein LOC127737028 [Mytilus californianus]
MSKDHKTMSTEDYKKLPEFMQELSSKCREHKKKFEIFCSFHACPCCVQCVNDKHKKCQDIKPLSDIIKQIKFSASVQLVEKDLKDVKENFEEIIKYLNSSMNTNNSQKLKATEKIRSIKKSIDDFLNKIEQEILADLDTKHSKLKSKMNNLLQQLELRANQISQLQSGFSEMTRLATDLQMCFGLREIEKTTTQAVQYLEDLQNGDNFNEKNLEVTISSSLQSICKDVKSFGDININISPSTLRIEAGRKDQAQYLVPTVTRIEKIKPHRLRTSTIPESTICMHIFACRTLPGGKYLILYHSIHHSHLLLFSNDDMSIKKKMTFIPIFL